MKESAKIGKIFGKKNVFLEKINYFCGLNKKIYINYLKNITFAFFKRIF